MDFISDSLSDGRRVLMLNMIDDYNREVLAVEPGLSFPVIRVICVLQQLEEENGLPKVIRVDNCKLHRESNCLKLEKLA